jgi:hypothetical protein
MMKRTLQIQMKKTRYLRYALNGLLLLLLTCTGAHAQTLAVVGTAASTSSLSGLSSSTTSGTRNERHACIYSAAELSAAGLSANSILTGIAWEKTGDASYAGNDLTIRIWLKHSATTTFSASPVFSTETTSATQVYETATGTIPAAAGWLPFNFDAPFTWNGTDAIEVITELIRPASWTVTGFSWRTITSVTNAAANASAASSSPPASLTRTGTRPQIRLEVATAGNDAALTAMPAPVSGIPGAQNIDVVLRNTGSATLTAAGIAWTINGSAPVTYNWTGSLQPGAGTAVTLTSQSFALGTNVITATVTSANGSADAGAGNNTQSKTVETCFPLSGNYTINGTIAPSATNFSSFTDLAAKLSSCGVGGNVTVNVTTGSGPYNEQVTFAGIPGLGPTATVTINGNANVITATTTTENRHIIRLRDLQYFTINDLKIQMDTTSPGGFMGIHIMGSGHHIALNNNEVDMKAETSTLFGGLIASGSESSILETGTFHNLNFTNNKIIGGGYGVSVFGLVTDLATNIIISGNQFFDFNSNGVYLRETNGAVVNNNLFHKTAGAGGVTNGVQMAQTANVNASIYNNYFKVSQANGGLRAIYLFAGTGHKVYNNVITDIQSTSGEITGIQLRAAATAPQVYNNTIAINHTAGTSGNLYGIRLETANTGAVLRNNVVNISQATTGFKAGIMLSAATGVSASFSSNNNLFWIPGAQVAGYTNVTTPTGLAANLAAWQGLGQDANSTEADPQMFSATLPIPTNAAVANLGVPYAGLTTDIQGNTRNAVTPDLGAYEYSLPLPVKLVRFYGERRSGVDKLYWHTSKEENNAGFDIEQSANGTDFLPVGHVSSLAPGGNSSHLCSYSFENKHIQEAVSYYRLKQIDKDGRFFYSTIVKLNGTVNNTWEVSLFPNPASAQASLRIVAGEAENATIIISDLQGREIIRSEKQLVRGPQVIALDMASLPGGTYILKVSGTAQAWVGKLSKQ